MTTTMFLLLLFVFVVLLRPKTILDIDLPNDPGHTSTVISYSPNLVNLKSLYTIDPLMDSQFGSVITRRIQSILTFPQKG